jgi:hypothetical protein
MMGEFIMAPRIKPTNRHCVQSDHTSPLFASKDQRSASSALGQNIWLDLMITKVGGVSHPEGRRLSPQWLMASDYQRPVSVEGYSIFERRWAI